jgi:hypothetical protein
MDYREKTDASVTFGIRVDEPKPEPTRLRCHCVHQLGDRCEACNRLGQWLRSSSAEGPK